MHFSDGQGDLYSHIKQCMYMSDERGGSVLGNKGDKRDWEGEKREGQEEGGWSRENVQQTTETVMKNYINE